MRLDRASKFTCACAAASLAFATSALSLDEPGSKDHELVGRYEGASIAFYKVSDFDEEALLQAPHDFGALLDRDAVADRSGPEWLRLAGKVTKIRYEIPAGRSSLEVLRNYQAALKRGGFEILFDCADQSCFAGTIRDPYLLGQQLDTDNGDTGLYLDHARYFLARLTRDGGSVFAGILVGEDNARTTAFVDIIETGEMESGKITFIDAGKMANAIAKEKKVDLYGITFDFDRAELRPESTSTLAKIAKLLTDHPELRIEVVGHTDNRGAADYNMDLSTRRAASVIAALIDTYGIDPSRLVSSGAGMTSPIASNDTPEGQAKNRRVELVAK